MAVVIRTALDRYLDDVVVDADRALAVTFGAAADASVPGRDEWSRE